MAGTSSLEDFGTAAMKANRNDRKMPMDVIDAFLVGRSVDSLFQEIARRPNAKAAIAALEQILFAKPELTRTTKNFKTYLFAAISSEHKCLQKLALDVLRRMHPQDSAPLLHGAVALCESEDTGIAQLVSDLIVNVARDPSSNLCEGDANNLADAVHSMVASFVKRSRDDAEASTHLVRAFQLVTRLCGSSYSSALSKRFLSNGALNALSKCVLASCRDPLLSLSLIEALPSVVPRSSSDERILSWLKNSKVLETLLRWTTSSDNASDDPFASMLRAPSIVALGRILANASTTIESAFHDHFVASAAAAMRETDDETIVNSSFVSIQAYADGSISNATRVATSDAFVRAISNIVQRGRGLASRAERNAAATAATNLVASLLRSLHSPDDATSSAAESLMNRTGGLRSLVNLVCERSNTLAIDERRAASRAIASAVLHRGICRSALSEDRFRQWLVQTPSATAEDLGVRDIAVQIVSTVMKTETGQQYVIRSGGESFHRAMEAIVRASESDVWRPSRSAPSAAVKTAL